MRAVAYLTVGAALLAASAAYAKLSYAATNAAANEVKHEGKLVQFV